ncbi:lipocalin family protein [Streptomyces sp. NPDC051987]|uniref:lipocalin family protein n=1 Tax=Streptomyces sp. NPDC051987 TaxID=3155808 RepID=UPI003426042D
MKRATLTSAGVAVAATAVLGAALMPAAQAAGRDSRTTSTTTTYAGIPEAVHPAADLAAKTPGSGPGWSDSIYINSMVKADGHKFGVLVQTLNQPNVDSRQMLVTVSDQKTGWYKSYRGAIAKDDYTWSTKGLNIKMPGLTWTGDAHKMSVKATTPWGSLDFQLKNKGPALKYAGTGSFPLLGDTQYEYAFPSMRTTGTLAVRGKTHKVSGETWLDRQWGGLSLNDKAMHWTWMDLRLSNGDKVAVWDFGNSKTGNSWATVLHPDGSYELAAVKPLADGAHRFWTSPTSGKTYPTRWSVDIPSLKAHLAVRVTGTDAQDEGGGAYEGTISAAGTYEGKKVTGEAYVEMVGTW